MGTLSPTPPMTRGEYYYRGAMRRWYKRARRKVCHEGFVYIWSINDVDMDVDGFISMRSSIHKFKDKYYRFDPNYSYTPNTDEPVRRVEQISEVDAALYKLCEDGIKKKEFIADLITLIPMTLIILLFWFFVWII